MSFTAIFKLFAEADVDFIVVGSVALTLQGVMAAGLDTQLVHSLSEENVAKLVPALESISSIFRNDHNMRPDAHSLMGPGNRILLLTIHGPLDLLCSVGTSLSFNTCFLTPGGSRWMNHTRFVCSTLRSARSSRATLHLASMM